MDKNNWSYSFSWTQPYVSMNEFFQGQSCREIYNALAVEEELDRLDKADEAVQNMTTFPDAEAIIQKVRNGQ